ncbi:HalOD1 output domain-containing protein [Natronomonas marina]|jgi:hypothetical protein|uniref:HalOD1 output domain-containing protein n=1 Tax=Natronomonas marina TaxID=2961939 RepID=UPI0020C9CEE2|nr:HalOD1 output domain-containing protein [Natronomonas marina]
MSGLKALIEAVADAKDKEADQLEIMLEDHIPTGAIRDLNEHESESWRLQFELPNHTVKIEQDDSIVVDDTQY